MATALVAISSQTLSTTASSVTFSSIPSIYRDLRLVTNYSTTATGNQATYVINSDSGANYYHTNVRGYAGPVIASSSASSLTNISAMYTTGVTTGEYCVQTLDFIDYSATDKFKSVLIRSSHFGEVADIIYRWQNTAAINTLTVNSPGTTFPVGSTFSLFGVLA